MAKKKSKKKDKEILCVQICCAKPNKLFSEEQTASLRFLRYNKPVACAECGKKKRTLWTLLCQFRAADFGIVTLVSGDKSHLPLTPVCQDHPLEPDCR